MPRVASSAEFRKIEPQTGRVIDEFPLGVIGSCTRLTATTEQFYFRPGGGEGRTVYVDFKERKLAPYEGIVRPGCFDGVVPANGRLYWMPLACDCWQIHDTFSMAPRTALKKNHPADNRKYPKWDAPVSSAPAAETDWPVFRSDCAGSATVQTAVLKNPVVLWKSRVNGGDLTAPVCARERVLLGGADGLVTALESRTGKMIWRTSADSAVLYPPVYWKGRAVFGSCDGKLYCLDATDGRLLGSVEIAPERRFVNIMNRFISAWPLSGGVLVNEKGIAYTAAGSTAADGSVVAAFDITTGECRWRQAYTYDREEVKLSFGVQGNLLLKNNTLYINGGAPVGIVALDTSDGGNPRIVSRLDAGRSMFLEPGNRPSSWGLELFSKGRTRTTVFKRHQGRVYFQTAGRHIGLIDGRLFCSRDIKGLDRIVDMMNKDPQTGGKMGGLTVPWDVLKIPVNDSILWAGRTSDLRGLAVGSDAVVVLHRKSVECLSLDGKSLWTVDLPASPVIWGIALTEKSCVVTLTDGSVVCLSQVESG